MCKLLFTIHNCPSLIFLLDFLLIYFKYINIIHSGSWKCADFSCIDLECLSFKQDTMAFFASFKCCMHINNAYLVVFTMHSFKWCPLSMQLFNYISELCQLICILCFFPNISIRELFDGSQHQKLKAAMADILY